MPSIKSLLTKITGRPGNISILKNVGWLFFDKIVRLGLNFWLTTYIARYLGVENFGLWNYAIAFVAIFGIFTSLGMYQLLLHNFVKHPERKFELLRNAFSLKLAGGGITCLLSFVVICFLKPEEDVTQMLILITGLGYVAQSLDVIDYFFQSQLQSKLIASSRAIAFGFFSLIKIYLIYQRQPLTYFVWAQTGELLLGGLLLAFFFRKNFGTEFYWRLNFPVVRQILVQSAPIIFAEVAIILYMRIDQVMISEMLGNASLGIYSAAVKLSEIWYLFPGIICSSLFPSIIEVHNIDNIAYKRKLQQLYDILTWISLSIGICISLFAKMFVGFIYGPEFAAASSILVVHIWSGLFVFWGTASSQQLVVENLMRISFYRTLFGLVANIILNFLLIPTMGSIGSAIATLISQACSAWISNLFFASTRSVFWMNLNSLNPLRLIKNKS